MGVGPRAIILRSGSLRWARLKYARTVGERMTLTAIEVRIPRVGLTTPTRATARARKQPTGSTPKLARVKQPRTTVVNPA